MPTININRLKQIIQEELANASRSAAEKKKAPPAIDPKLPQQNKALADVANTLATAFNKLSEIDNPYLKNTDEYKQLDSIIKKMLENPGSLLSIGPNPAVSSDLTSNKKPADVSNPASVGGGQAGLVSQPTKVVKPKVK